MQKSDPGFWVLIGLVGVTRLTYALVWAGNGGGGFEYTDIAKNIAAGQGYVGPGFFYFDIHPTAFLAPVFSYLLAGAIWLAGLPAAYTLIQLVQVAVSIGTAAAIGGIANLVASGARSSWKINPSRVSRTAMILYLIHTPLWYGTFQMWDTPLFIGWVTWIVYATLSWKDSLTWKHGLLMGGMLGGATLTNAVAWILWPIVAISWWTTSKKLTITFIGTALLILAPWTLRNYGVFNAFIPVRTYGWFNVYLGNNPDATGTVYLRVNGTVPINFVEGLKRHFEPLRPRLAPLNEVDQDRLFRDLAIQFWREYPFRSVGLTLKKIWFFWTVNWYEKSSLKVIWLIQHFLLLGLSFYALWLFRPWTSEFRVIIGVFAVFTLVYAVTGPFLNWKYRLPLDPLLIVLAALALNRPHYFAFTPSVSQLRMLP